MPPSGSGRRQRELTGDAKNTKNGRRERIAGERRWCHRHGVPGIARDSLGRRVFRDVQPCKSDSEFRSERVVINMFTARSVRIIFFAPHLLRRALAFPSSYLVSFKGGSQWLAVSHSFMTRKRGCSACRASGELATTWLGTITPQLTYSCTHRHSAIVTIAQKLTEHASAQLRYAEINLRDPPRSAKRCRPRYTTY